MIGIRQKLMLGFGGLLAIIAIVGSLTMVQISDDFRMSEAFYMRSNIYCFKPGGVDCGLTGPDEIHPVSATTKL